MTRDILVDSLPQYHLVILSRPPLKSHVLFEWLLTTPFCSITISSKLIQRYVEDIKNDEDYKMVIKSTMNKVNDIYQPVITFRY